MGDLNDAIFFGSSVCVVGNINRDIKTSPLAAHARLFEDGETSVASIVETVGGGGANSAAAAAALGAKVAFLGKVGADALGGRLERTLANWGIEAHLTRDPEQPSGTSIALTWEKGTRHFISCLPANQALESSDLDLGKVAVMRHLLRADVWFADAMLFGGNKQLFQQAQSMGLAVSLDLNWDPCWNVAGAETVQARKLAVREALPWVTLAHGNRRELMEFADAPDLETALQRITGWGAQAIVVHLGNEGAGYFCEGEWTIEPPVLAQSPRHATGTGDVLSVCMILMHHMTERPIRERLRWANTVVAEFMEGKRHLIPDLAP